MEATRRYITLHLIAETPELLSQMTVVAQLNWGIETEFFDFSQLKNGQFICWYKVPLALFQERMVNG